MGLFRDITSTYSGFESWFYDRTVAGSVLASQAGLVDSLLADVAIGGSVLDVGCGGGHLALSVAERADDVSVVGVDLSPDQVERATQRAGGLRERVTFRVASATDLPFADDCFSTVVSVGSIKHWPDRAAGMAELVRVLRPGGRLTVLEIDRGCTFEAAQGFVARMNAPKLARGPLLWHFRTYVAGQGLELDEARAMVRDLPLQDVSVSRIPQDPTLLVVGRKAAA
ncbi:class I SAM-dependent methyltransferase [Nocardia nova]|uniref:class I SAM-dependent methyltransferase n=1 Tax=Nocardia nova TaxID=37330 RepID=UPI0018959349|nr:class I SAM-dependent methyltransferase [Nocardia nova]MBF6146417.1 methyltransferase domain-containing protein [Nocardia nova]MDN2500491.1 class I SAM-dependent methyltransferase [Nocardia nova]